MTVPQGRLPDRARPLDRLAGGHGRRVTPQARRSPLVWRGGSPIDGGGSSPDSCGDPSRGDSHFPPLLESESPIFALSSLIRPPGHLHRYIYIMGVKKLWQVRAPSLTYY